MAIPESQLETWSHQGAVVGSANTHNSIKNALAAYKWPDGVKHDPYLQGSYRNSTNIRGDSDVDLVVELTSVFYNNLTADEKSQLGLTSAIYSWSDFKNAVISALTSYYGSEYVDTSGSKSVKVLPDNNRLKADAVVCATYRYYEDLKVRAEGITFLTTSGLQIINYPKLHFDNGVSKNSDYRTGGCYKPAIRMFKNTRNRIIDSDSDLKDCSPSYFVECLLYNVPDKCFKGTFQEIYANVVNHLNKDLDENSGDYVCQSGMHYLFGQSVVQWNLANAKELIKQLITLWNNW